MSIVKRAVLLALLCLPLFALADDLKPGYPPVRTRDGILVDLKGRGLYTFDGDPIGKSKCINQCRLLWPPITAEADAKPMGSFTVLDRGDGSRQWAYKGKPLYRWASDKNRGDAGGEGVAGVWHLVHIALPAATAPAPPPASASAPTTH